MTTGYIYVLQNEAFPHLLKIGKTTRSPEDRAAELSSTGVPHPFQVLFSWKVSDCDFAETQIHQALSHARANADREFFKIAPQEAKRTISDILGGGPATPSNITLGKCFSMIVFVTVFWGLMTSYAEPIPPEKSWVSRLWCILYLSIASVVIVTVHIARKLFNGRKRERTRTAIIQGIAGVLFFYFGYRLICTFF